MAVLTYLGHACFCIETDAAALLIDPWLSPKGAFLGSWRQLPPNDHCLEWVIAKARSKPMMIYVTHEHEDHYDEETLKALLPLASGLIIPDYENDFMLNLVERHLRVAPRLARENELQHFHDIAFRIFISESGINRDSAIFVEAGGLTFLDCNDCKIFDRAPWLLENCGRIDVLTAQFSGANMHPTSYDMPAEAYRRISRQKRMRKFRAVHQFIEDLGARYFVPSAGPAVFPAPEHYALNFETDGVFPKWWEFRSFCEARNGKAAFVALDVGGTAAPAHDGTIGFNGLAEPLTDHDIDDFIAYYRLVDARHRRPAMPPEAEIVGFFERGFAAKARAMADAGDMKAGCPLYLELVRADGTGLAYRIDPDRPMLEKLMRCDPQPPYYLHRTSAAAIGRLMLSGKGWGTYYLSLLFRSRRDPDTYDSVLGTFFVANDEEDLRFGLRKLVEFRDNDEYVVLHSPDGARSVSCKRYCPHQGADLKYAHFDGRYIICPRHHWKFDCEQGGLADHSRETLDATIQDGSGQDGSVQRAADTAEVAVAAPQGDGFGEAGREIGGQA